MGCRVPRTLAAPAFVPAPRKTPLTAALVLRWILLAALPAGLMQSLASVAGILRISRAELNAAAEGRVPAVHPRIFGIADGIRGGSDIILDASPSAWKTASGRLCFATRGGMLEIDPNRLQFNARVPPVLI